MTWAQNLQLLFFEADLYDMYASKIDGVKSVLKSFDGKQVSSRITSRLQQVIPQDDCIIGVEKSDNNLRIIFSSQIRSIDVGNGVAYAANNKDSILCLDAVEYGRLVYRLAEPQIEKASANWRNKSMEYKTTDYSKLQAEYIGIAEKIKDFQKKLDCRISDLLNLQFFIKNSSYR